MHTYAIYYRIDGPKWADKRAPKESAWAVLAEISHRKVCEILVPGLDSVFRAMQADNWSPQGQAQTLIEGLGLQHTSLSLGDVAVLLDENGEPDAVYECRPFGWTVLADVDAGAKQDAV